MIAPCRDTEDRQRSSTSRTTRATVAQHGPFGLLLSHPKLQRHGALVVLSERHVHMRERPGIAERVLHSRDDADHPDRLPRFRSLGVEELNQPPECVLSRPQPLRERIVDDRDRAPEPGASSASLKSRPPSMGSPRTRA